MVPVLYFSSNNGMNMRNPLLISYSVQPGIIHIETAIQTADNKLPIIGIDRPPSPCIHNVDI